MAKQKRKTGIAIWGKPDESLLHDDKFGGNCILDSVAVGEGLALVVLSAEILVLLLCSIGFKEWRHCFGLSQYPKFKKNQLLGQN